MSDTKSTDKPATLSELLEPVLAEAEERERREREIDELTTIGVQHIDPGLAMALHFQCAIRHVDWPALLADAVSDALRSQEPN